MKTNKIMVENSKTLALFLILLLPFLFTVQLSVAQSDEIFIPDYTKIVIKFWLDDQISDETLAMSLGFLVDKEIIVLTDFGAVEGIRNEPSIPEWVKEGAQFWVDGLITDMEFSDSIKYLVENNIILPYDGTVTLRPLQIPIPEPPKILTESTPVPPSFLLAILKPGYLPDFSFFSLIQTTLLKSLSFVLF